MNMQIVTEGDKVAVDLQIQASCKLIKIEKKKNFTRMILARGNMGAGRSIVQKPV